MIIDDPTQLHNKGSHRYINNEPTKRDREGEVTTLKTADCTAITALLRTFGLKLLLLKVDTNSHRQSYVIPPIKQLFWHSITLTELRWC